MNHRNSSVNVMGLAALIASLVVLISFFLPFITIELIGTTNITCMELITYMLEEAFQENGVASLVLPGCLLCGVIALICALIGLAKSGKALLGTAICCGIGMIVMLLVYIVEVDILWGSMQLIEMAGYGFYVFLLASLAALICSLLGMNAASGSSRRRPTPGRRPPQRPTGWGSGAGRR